MLQVAMSMVWEARVIQIRPHIVSEKEMKLGYQVEPRSSEIYVRRDSLDHETFFGHHKITRALQFSSLRPVITVLPQTLKWTRTS